MKIGTVTLERFKRFRQKTLDFSDETGNPKSLVVLVGDNGTGKSTILQAIALTIGKAAKRIKEFEELNWPGFDINLVHESWKIPERAASIICKVAFEADELEAITACFNRTAMANDPNFTPPGRQPLVNLRYYPSRQIEADSASELFQFYGRDYAQQVFRELPEGRQIFQRVGSVFWYTQHRTATSLMRSNGDGQTFNIDDLRQRLSEWQNFHLQVTQRSYELKPYQRNLYADLLEAYQRFFPDRDFVGTFPRDPDDAMLPSWFYLSQGRMDYEISEMSAGELALFPIIFDFVNWDINRSIILIDEAELHLHPPLQQAFVRGLPLLGKDNQFIITTHSEAVLDAVSEDSIYRLEA